MKQQSLEGRTKQENFSKKEPNRRADVFVSQTKLGRPIIPDGEPLVLKQFDVLDVILVGP